MRRRPLETPCSRGESRKPAGQRSCWSWVQTKSGPANLPQPRPAAAATWPGRGAGDGSGDEASAAGDGGAGDGFGAEAQSWTVDGAGWAPGSAGAQGAGETGS